MQALVILLSSLVSTEARLGLCCGQLKKNQALALLWIFSKLLGRTGSKPPWLAQPSVGSSRLGGSHRWFKTYEMAAEGTAGWHRQNCATAGTSETSETPIFRGAALDPAGLRLVSMGSSGPRRPGRRAEKLCEPVETGGTGRSACKLACREGLRTARHPRRVPSELQPRSTAAKYHVPSRARSRR